MADCSIPTISAIVEHETVEPYIPPVQSANSLFRFFKKQSFLFDALKNSALIPRYYTENVDYLTIEHKNIAYPMVCFCDITVHRLANHVGYYGAYGIAFSKEWGLNKGIQPVQYINNNSELRKQFCYAFAEAIEQRINNAPANFLLSQMSYIKPIVGTMPRDGKVDHKNFTDECEWRYVPNVDPLDLPSAVVDDDIVAIDSLNKTIATHDSCWLKFKPDEIKYIILPDNDSLDDICTLFDELSISDPDKRRLLSKIIIWENAKEDF